MLEPLSNFFTAVNRKPNPRVNTTLRGYRDQRRRPFLCNPFEPAQPLASGEVEITNLPNLSHQPAKPSEGDSCEEKQDDPAKKATSFDNTQNENYDHGTGEPPEWLTLFYDLAWTASFSSITSNNKFKDLWDSVSYIAFFTVAWWIWMSQVFYSVDFYTDDWFNLGVIFSQFIIFGFLAAVMREVDVSTYIVHSPGSETLESYQVMTTTPEQYAADKIAKKSFELVAIVVAVSRALLLAQHIIVNIFAKRTYQSRRYPYRLLVIPFSLVISTGLFFAGYIITKKHGEEAKGATLKFILWGTGILVEAIAHIARFQWEINDGLRLKSRGSIVGRLTTITTIIVGEGINAIAGTLYFIEKAPDFSGTMAIGVICCAIIVFFLVYLYFESAAPLNQPVRRRAAWAMAHLPWLLSVILLLEGVKNQLLLSNFLNSGNYIVDQTYNALAAPFNDEQKFNATFEHIMLQAGMTWDDQFQKLNDLLQNQNITDADIAQLDPSVDEVVGVWYARLQTSNILNMYLNFMTNETISEDVQKLINRYQNDYAFTYQDTLTPDPGVMGQIIWGLMKPSVQNAQYITALSGLTFIFLATLNLIQSWPRDRYQWGSIISRYTIGASMTLLLLMNIGKIREYFPPAGVSESDRLPVFKWIDANWVLPTLAIAYGLQFLIDTRLVYAAKRSEDWILHVSEQADKSN